MFVEPMAPQTPSTLKALVCIGLCRTAGRRPAAGPQARAARKAATTVSGASSWGQWPASGRRVTAAPIGAERLGATLTVLQEILDRLTVWPPAAAGPQA
jgi:hypothetical protein